VEREGRDRGEARLGKGCWELPHQTGVDAPTVDEVVHDHLEDVKFAISHTPAFHVIIENYQLTTRCKNPPDLSQHLSLLDLWHMEQCGPEHSCVNALLGS